MAISWKEHGSHSFWCWSHHVVDKSPFGGPNLCIGMFFFFSRLILHADQSFPSGHLDGFTFNVRTWLIVNKPSYPICSVCLCLQADDQKHWLWKLLAAASLKTCYVSTDWNPGFSVVKDGGPLLPFPHSNANPPAEGHPRSFWAGRYMGHGGNNQDVFGVGFLAARSCASHSFFWDGGSLVQWACDKDWSSTDSLEKVKAPARCIVSGGLLASKIPKGLVYR